MDPIQLYLEVFFSMSQKGIEKEKHCILQKNIILIRATKENAVRL
jgi:hypothetical protein